MKKLMLLLVFFAQIGMAQDSLLFQQQKVVLKIPFNTYVSDAFNYIVSNGNIKKIKITMGYNTIYEGPLSNLKFVGATSDLQKISILSASKSFFFTAEKNDTYLESEITSSTVIAPGLYKEICISPKVFGGTYTIQIDSQTPIFNNTNTRTYSSKAGVISNSFTITPTNNSTILISKK